ncbi:unnamed protein product, partial [Brenthis ino]
MEIEDLHINVVKLISLIKQKPLLWDKSTELYKHRNSTRAAWRTIMVALIPGFENMDENTRRLFGKLVHQKWTHVRDNYHRSIKKQEQQKVMGGKRVKRYVYSNQLKFLDKVLKPNETKSTEGSCSDEDTEINLNKSDIISLPSIGKGSIIQSSSGLSKSDPAPAEAKVRFMDDNSYQYNPNNRHISFFYGILPTLHTLDDDEVLEFQVGVLQLLRTIKKNRSKVSDMFNMGSCQSNSDSRSIFVKSPDCDSVYSDVIECKDIL